MNCQSCGTNGHLLQARIEFKSLNNQRSHRVITLNERFCAKCAGDFALMREDTRPLSEALIRTVQNTKALRPQLFED